MQLDCESFESAVESAAAILDMSGGEITEKLLRFDYEKLPEDDRRSFPYEELLTLHTLGVGRDKLPSPSTIHWFHATRVAPDTSFKDGILPLSVVLDRTWEFLGKLASIWSTPIEWQTFRTSMRGRFADQYRRKVTSPYNEGPFAFLVRPIIFLPDEFGNHDFLGIPELIEDISLSYEEMLGHPLRQRFFEATRPCIVKFRSRTSEAAAVPAVLMYIHRSVRREDLSLNCNTCYSGDGVAIPAEDILRIEWPEA